MPGYFRRSVRCSLVPGRNYTKLTPKHGIRRRLRRILRWTLLLIGVVVLLAVGIALALLHPRVQTALGHWLGDRVGRNMGITLRIERLELRPFGPNRLFGVHVSDLRGDTLVHVDTLVVRALRWNGAERRLSARLLELHGARFALAKAEGDAHSNLTNLLDRLGEADTTSGGGSLSIHCARFDIRRLHFSFHDANIPPIPFGVDFDHVDVSSADVIGTQLRVQGDSILAELERISLRDHSGLWLQELSGSTKVSPRGIRIAGMRLRTPGTLLNGDLRFTTESFAAYDAFETEVRMRVDLDSSIVQFADIALFAPDLQGIDLPVRLSGHYRGTVSELKGRDMDLRFGERSVFKGNAELQGLPDIANTFMVVDVERFETGPGDLAALPVPPFTEGGRLQLPDEVTRCGDIHFQGNFTGFVSAFTAYGRLGTDAGDLRTDLTYRRDTVSGQFALNGHVASDGFDLGRLLDDATVGTLACDVNVKANGPRMADIRAELAGTVPHIRAAGMDLGGISLNGLLERNRFEGRLRCADPKARFTFNGLADLRGRWPVVDFTANVEHMDPRALGIIGGQGYSSLSMKVTAQGELAPDSLKGLIALQDVFFCDDSLDLPLGNIDLASDRSEGRPLLTLRSDLADADVLGPFYPTKLPDALQSVLFSVFPSLQAQVRYAHEEQDFTFDLVVKDAQRLLDAVVPGLVVDSGTVCNGNFDSRTFDLGLNATIPHIQYGSLSGDSVDVVLDKTLDVLAFRFNSARQGMGRGGTFLSGISLTGKAYQDEVQLRMGWSGSDHGTEGDLNMNALVRGPRSVTVDLLPSSLYFGRGNWRNERTATIDIDSSTIRVDSLRMDNGGQSILLDGIVSRDATMPLRFALAGVRMENAARFIDGPAIAGVIDGDGSLFDLYDKPYLLSELCVDSLTIDRYLVGNLFFSAGWNERTRHVDLAGELRRDTVRALGFDGRLAPGAADELDVDLTFDRFDLRFLEPFLPEGISDVQGRLTGHVDLTGRLAEPQVNGEVMANEAGLRIDYLNTKYTFTNALSIRPDQFFMDNVTLRDELGGTAHCNSFTVNHTALSRWNFDVAAYMDSLLVLNTRPSDNALYYGRAFGRGDLYVDGFAENLNITVDARTVQGTDIHFPLGGSAEVGGLPYVRFVGPEGIVDSLMTPVDLTGIHLDMKVGVTPDARFELIFDPTVGDIMKGSGRGDIQMTVTPTGEFSMKGGVEITEGEYLFTLRNLVNKKFVVDRGGTITWFGDPFDAQLNLNAVYPLRTALYDIMPPGERSEAYKQRVNVEVGMHLTDKLMNPNIDFQVRLPSVDEGTRTQVNSILSDKDKLNRQVFALLVVNKFLPEDVTQSTGFTSDVVASGTSTMAEFASSQLSNFMNNFSDRVDLGLNYRPGNSIAADEWEVAVGTGLFNNRILVSTNVGISGASGSSGQRGSQFIGDFSAEYLITPDGKFRVKAYSQNNDRNLNQLNQAATTQGAGVAYQREFD